MLAQAVQVRILRELGSEPEILRLKDQAGGRSIKQDLAGCSPGDGKGEWLLGVVESESRLSSRVASVNLWPGEDGFGDLVHVVGGILDLDMQSGFCNHVSDSTRIDLSYSMSALP